MLSAGSLASVRERERDLVLSVVGKSPASPVSLMGQIYSGMAVSVFAASVSCRSSLLGRPFLTQQQQLGRCCFRLLLFRGGENSKRGETSLSPEAGIGGGAGGHVSLAILPSVTE